MSLFGFQLTSRSDQPEIIFAAANKLAIFLDHVMKVIIAGVRRLHSCWAISVEFVNSRNNLITKY